MGKISAALRKARTKPPTGHAFKQMVTGSVAHRTRCCEGSGDYPVMIHLILCTSCTVGVML